MPLRRPSEKTTVFVCQSNWHLTRFSSSPFVPLVFSLSPLPTLSSICIACSVPISLHLHIFLWPLCFSLLICFFFFHLSVGVLRHSSSRASGGSGPPCGNADPAFAPSSAPPTATCREDRGHRGLQTTLLPVSTAQHSTTSHLIYSSTYLPEEGASWGQ